APEEIRWRRGNHQEVRLEGIDAATRLGQAEIVRLGIQQKRIVSGGVQAVAGEQQFQRNMRFPATEVGRAVEVPIGIDESKLHPALPDNSVARANDPTAGADARLRMEIAPWFSSQNLHKSWIVVRRAIFGFHPVSRAILALSVT